MRVRFLIFIFIIGFACEACSPVKQAGDSTVELVTQPRIFIIGQDLGAIRGYIESGCCIAPEGYTAYINLYNVLSEPFSYGGLGLDPEGKLLDEEWDDGAGPLNVRKTATEFKGGLAVGLELVENNHPGALSQLIAGDYDEQIRQLARLFKMIEGPVWLRVGYEFDGAWNHGYDDAEKYKSAFRYVVDRLREADVDNVEYVWQSSTSPVDDVIDQRHEDISKWYPGDDYVDWMGVSMFLTLDEVPVAQLDYDAPSQRELTDELVNFARARGKPVLIAEASPQGYDIAQNLNANIATIWDGPSRGDITDVSDLEIWEAWYAPLFKYMNENDDVIRGFAYINVNWDAQSRWGEPHNEGYWGDSRLEANPEIARRFNLALTNWRDR